MTDRSDEQSEAEDYRVMRSCPNSKQGREICEKDMYRHL